MQPKARHENLSIQDLLATGETLDLHNHKAHCLNTTSARLWRLCNGRTTLQALGQIVSKRLGLDQAEPAPARHEWGV
jgi:hypothetical protein